MLLQETVIEIDDDRLPRTEGGCNLNTIAVYSSTYVGTFSMLPISKLDDITIIVSFIYENHVRSLQWNSLDNLNVMLLLNNSLCTYYLVYTRDIVIY